MHSSSGTLVGASAPQSVHSSAQIRAQDKEAARRGATPTQRHVLKALGLRQNEYGTAFPSLATLVDETGYSDRTVRDALAALRQIEMLGVLRDPTPRRSTLYQIPIVRVPERKQSGSGYHSGWQPLPPKSPSEVPKEENKDTSADTSVRVRAHVVPTPTVPRVEIASESLSPAWVPVSPPAARGPVVPPESIRFEIPTLPPSAPRSAPVAPPARVLGGLAPVSDPAPLRTRAQRSEANKRTHATSRAQWLGKPITVAARPTPSPEPRKPSQGYKLPEGSGPALSSLSPEAFAEAKAGWRALWPWFNRRQNN